MARHKREGVQFRELTAAERAEAVAQLDQIGGAAVEPLLASTMLIVEKRAAQGGPEYRAMLTHERGGKAVEEISIDWKRSDLFWVEYAVLNQSLIESIVGEIGRPLVER